MVFNPFAQAATGKVYTRYLCLHALGGLKFIGQGHIIMWKVGHMQPLDGATL